MAPPLQDAVFTLVNSETPISNVFILCSDTVIKTGLYSSLYSESLALNFVRSHTSIPVPKVRRCIQCTDDPSDGCLLLEKIEGGKPLNKLWPSLSPFQRFLTAWTLRNYVHELRRASALYPRRHIPGPMTDTDTPKRCRGPPWLFGSTSIGPFNSAADLLDDFSMVFLEDGQRFDDSEPSLVLTHNDLSLRNIVVAQDGTLWVVDWAWSGFYPPWFEYIATMSAAENDKALRSWWNYIPLVTGAWVKLKNMLGFQNFWYVWT